MGQFASDPFTGVAGTELSAYNAAWVQHSASGAGADARISDANRLRSTGATGGTACYYHTANPASADYWVSADIYEASDANHGAGVIARCATADKRMYFARWNSAGATDVVQLYKFDAAGTPTQLGSDFNANFTTGATRNLKLECIGTAIKVYIDGSGTASISVTDSDITAAGKAGVRLGFTGSAVGSNATTLHLTNFSADEGGGGGGTIIPVFVNHYQNQGIM